jgi:hypothetical protein
MLNPLWRLARYLLGTDTDPLIDSLISRPRVRYEGLDERLRQQTAKRRELAEDIRRDAMKIETQDDRRSRIHIA